MLQRRSFFLSLICSAHLLLARAQVSRFGWGTGSKSWWASSEQHCLPVVVPPDVHAFSVHLGTRGVASIAAPRVQSKEVSVSPWQTDFFFRRMNVPVLCEYAGVIKTKREVDK